MAASTEIVNITKAAYASETASNNVENIGRNERHHLLLSTTYGLNSSYTKKIHVGLLATGDGCFAPNVKLTGNYAEGICFDVSAWQRFQASLEHMRLYLCENQSRPNPITFDNIVISFTSAYGARAVLVAYRENTEHTVNNVEADDQPPTKKRKNYAVAVVMQKTTFLGLENIAKCVNAHLTQLTTINEDVNTCVKYMINEIDLKLPVSYVDREIIKLTVRDNYEEIKRAVRTQLTNLIFLDVYFDIVFVELLSLRFSEISHIILLKR